MAKTFRLLTDKNRAPVTVEMLRGAAGRDGAPGRDGASGRDGPTGKDGAPGKDATTIGAIATGTAAAPSIPAGGDVTVTVPLSPALTSTSYVAAITLGGTSTLLGAVDYRGYAEKTKASISVRLRNNGLLVPASAVTVDVIAVRTP